MATVSGFKDAPPPSKHIQVHQMRHDMLIAEAPTLVTHITVLSTGLLDSLVGGGLVAGMTVAETVVKEAMEEANVPEALAATATSAGSVSFFYRSERGLFPNTEFVFDLELPESFEPGNNDGEVSGFQLTPVKDIVSIITSQVDMVCKTFVLN